MKNSIFKKLVALSLAVLMLVGSGIGAALAGIDLAGLVGIKASAEDPHNDIFYDEEKGFFFEVVGGRANIFGSSREAVLNSPCMNEGVFTLPNKVTDSLTGIEYYVFELSPAALFNIRLDVTKLIIPDNFRALTLPEASFAGWDNLSEVQWDIHNATVGGPLFEYLCEYVDDGEICNAFPVRDEYGEPVFNEDGTEILVRFYSKEVHNGFTTEYVDMFVPFEENIEEIQTLTNINTVSYKDINISLIPAYTFKAEQSDISFDDVSVGIYKFASDRTFSNPYPHDYSPDEVNPDSEADWNTYSYIDGVQLDTGSVSFSGSFTGGVANSYGSLVDGNASYHETNTIALHKSPVKVLTFGENVKSIPDYICYDLEIESVDLSNAEAIGKCAFVDCNNLQNVNLSSIKMISDWAFASCDGLTYLDLSKTESVGNWTFAACDGFTELIIPENVKNIGAGSFSFCDSLKSVFINNNICKYGSESVNPHEFGCRPSLFEEGHVPIEEYTFTPFTECKILTTFVFGKETYSAPSNIGYNVTTLKKVIFLVNDTPVSINDSAFKNCDSIDEIEVIDPEKWPAVAIGAGNNSILFDDITIKKHQHIFETKTVAATCSSEGYTVEICLCGTENGRSNPQPKLAHTLPDTPNTHIDASCEGQGYDLYNCTVCGEGVKKNVQPALEHDYVDTKTYPASCTEAGKTVGVCSRCQKEVVLETLPALNHDFGAYSYNNDATATRDGTETARCSRCGVTNTRTVPGTKTGDRLSNAAMSAGEEKDVEYSSKVVVTSRGYNIPSDYHLGIVANGKLVAEGTNEEVTYTADEVTEDTTFLTYIYDANGKIATKNPHKTDVAKVNNGFFARIIAFFKALFGLLPTVNFGK